MIMDLRLRKCGALANSKFHTLILTKCFATRFIECGKCKVRLSWLPLKDFSEYCIISSITRWTYVIIHFQFEFHHSYNNISFHVFFLPYRVEKMYLY